MNTRELWKMQFLWIAPDAHLFGFSSPERVHCFRFADTLEGYYEAIRSRIARRDNSLRPTLARADPTSPSIAEQYTIQWHHAERSTLPTSTTDLHR
jgi:hypothetical protein